jgi:hypothetical protein
VNLHFVFYSNPIKRNKNISYAVFEKLRELLFSSEENAKTLSNILKSLEEVVCHQFTILAQTVLMIPQVFPQRFLLFLLFRKERSSQAWNYFSSLEDIRVCFGTNEERNYFSSLEDIRVCFGTNEERNYMDIRVVAEAGKNKIHELYRLRRVENQMWGSGLSTDQVES